MKVFLASLLILTLCVAAVHAADHAEAPTPTAEGPTSIPKALTGPALVAEACKNATDPNICASSLNADPGTKTADLTRLALVTLRMAASSVATAWVHINETLNRHGFNPNNKDRYGCLSDCLYDYAKAVMLLDDSLATLNDKNYLDLKRKIGGGADLYRGTCEVCLSVLGPKKEKIIAESEVLKQLINNALTIISFLEASSSPMIQGVM